MDDCTATSKIYLPTTTVSSSGLTECMQSTVSYCAREVSSEVIVNYTIATSDNFVVYSNGQIIEDSTTVRIALPGRYTTMEDVISIRPKLGGRSKLRTNCAPVIIETTYDAITSTEAYQGISISLQNEDTGSTFVSGDSRMPIRLAFNPPSGYESNAMYDFSMWDLATNNSKLLGTPIFAALNAEFGAIPIGFNDTDDVLRNRLSGTYVYYIELPFCRNSGKHFRPGDNSKTQITPQAVPNKSTSQISKSGANSAPSNSTVIVDSELGIKNGSVPEEFKAGNNGIAGNESMVGGRGIGGNNSAPAMNMRSNDTAMGIAENLEGAPEETPDEMSKHQDMTGSRDLGNNNTSSPELDVLNNDAVMGIPRELKRLPEWTPEWTPEWVPERTPEEMLGGQPRTQMVMGKLPMDERNSSTIVNVPDNGTSISLLENVETPEEMLDEISGIMTMVETLENSKNGSSSGKDLQDNGSTMGDAEELEGSPEVSLEESPDESVDSMGTNGSMMEDGANDEKFSSADKDMENFGRQMGSVEERVEGMQDWMFKPDSDLGGNENGTVTRLGEVPVMLNENGMMGNNGTVAKEDRVGRRDVRVSSDGIQGKGAAGKLRKRKKMRIVSVAI